MGNVHKDTRESSVAQVNENRSKIYTDNVDFASTLVLSGNNFSKMKLFFRFYGAPVISSMNFHGYQRLFICPTIDNFYKKSKLVNIQLYARQLHNVMHAIVNISYI